MLEQKHIEKETLKMHKPRKERNYYNGGIPAELVGKFLKEYDL